VDAIPDKPTGSVIEVAHGPEGVTLSWAGPSPGLSRFPLAAFLLFWLGGWAFGWVAAAGQVARGGAPPFLIFWLGGWTVGGGFVIWSLWAMFRPVRPESVRLEAEKLRYDPGRAPSVPWQRHGWAGWDRPAAPKVTSAMTVDRSDIRGFVLDRIGERQRLCFDRGADRLEIGAGLREPEREWLFTILRKWHTPNSALQQTGASAAIAD
jgi:hypothetical protein